jgi:hypothetical protein
MEKTSFGGLVGETSGDALGIHEEWKAEAKKTLWEVQGGTVEAEKKLRDVSTKETTGHIERPSQGNSFPVQLYLNASENIASQFIHTTVQLMTGLGIQLSR